MEYRVPESSLTSIADAIRTKGGTSGGLSFPDGFISAVENIPTGGGSTLITKSITENGTYNASDDDADGYSSVSVLVPPPAGTKFITGTFQGTTSGAAMDVTIPYQGTGYPIAGFIYPTNGSWKDNDPIRTLAQMYAAITFYFIKNDISATPEYSSNIEENFAETFLETKNSDSDATKTTYYCKHMNRLYNSRTSASAYSDSIVRLKSSTVMSVYIAGSSYGFKEGIEYSYFILYSA